MFHHTLWAKFQNYSTGRTQGPGGGGAVRDLGEPF